MSHTSRPAPHPTDLPGGTLLEQIEASGGIRMENMRYLTDLDGPMPEAPTIRPAGFTAGFDAALDAARARLAVIGVDPAVLDGLVP